jgi:predicted DNA-binding transcriptional regulator YafY
MILNVVLYDFPYYHSLMLIDRLDARVAHMANLLLWEGRISRSRLMTLNGLSQVRASEWLRELRDRHPNWMLWDPRAKAYFATDAAYRAAGPAKLNAAPVFAKLPYLPDLEQAGGPMVGTNFGIASVSVQMWAFSNPSPKAFATIRLAIEEHTELRFAYRSMGNPEARVRIIEPHSLVQAGRRWHVRGYCPETQDFRDFVLGRMTELMRLEQHTKTTAADDKAWNTPVKVRLVAHPALSVAQQAVVGQEIFAGTSARVETCRGPLVPYFIQEVRAAVDIERQMPPDYQLAVANVEECRPWMFPS